MATDCMMVSVDLEAAYREHGVALVRFATLLVGPDDAGDVVADVVTATLARGAAEQIGDVRSYWLRAVMNTAASWHRSSRRRIDREQRMAHRDSTDPPDVATDARRLLAELTIQQRAVVYLSYWHDLPPAAVASTLGVSEGTVRKQLARARSHLREALSHERS